MAVAWPIVSSFTGLLLWNLKAKLLYRGNPANYGPIRLKLSSLTATQSTAGDHYIGSQSCLSRGFLTMMQASVPCTCLFVERRALTAKMFRAVLCIRLLQPSGFDFVKERLMPRKQH